MITFVCMCVCVCVKNIHTEEGKVWKDICKLVGCICPGGMLCLVFSFVFLFIGIFSFLQGLTVISVIQHSCRENPMDRGDWRAAVHRVAESWTRLK